MPWPETSVVKLRHEFVLKALEPHANIAELCRETGISRKTGYKWIQRFRESGLEGLQDLSRRPHRSPLRASGEAVMRLLELRGAHPRWGPKKLRVVLGRELDADEVPSIRTISRVLERAGEVRAQRRAQPAAAPTEKPSPDVEGPNDLWTIDFKGWWNARDGARCEPLTVRDDWSRMVLCAQLMDEPGADGVRKELERLFENHGLPKAILADNGPPFAMTRARCGMTTLSAWWVSLGIRLLRSRPGHPQDNGGHERMHLDLRYEVEDIGADDRLAQQAALDRWRHEFNHVRPHEALAQRTPAEVYRSSPRRFKGSRTPRYAPPLAARIVASSGRIRFRGHFVRVGSGFRGYQVGVEPIGESAVRIQFYELDLGRFQLPGQCPPA